MGYLQAKQYLDSLINYEIHLHKIDPSQFQLDRIIYLLDLLDNPQKHYKIIHVAGSKGKGSTSVMTATILHQAGFRVGLYTSPHLYDFKERIRVLKKPYRSRKKDELFCDAISRNEITDLVNQLKPFIDQIHREKKYGKLTYFEMLTALALLYFKMKKVDFAVLETGLGGRLDATNAVLSEIAVITPISLEHTNILGKTVEKIAAEKAGIIKNQKQVVVIAPQVKKVSEVLKKRCAQFQIHPRWVKQPIKFRTNLLGHYQKTNSAAALCVVDCLREKGYDIPALSVKSALKNIFWPGRMEIVKQTPLVIIDGAHNEDSVQKLIQSIKKLIRKKKVILIFGASKDKDIRGMLNQLKKISKQMIFTQANHPRSFMFSNKFLSGLKGVSLVLAENVSSAVKAALNKADTDDIILVAGSLFIVSEARRCIR